MLLHSLDGIQLCYLQNAYCVCICVCVHAQLVSEEYRLSCIYKKRSNLISLQKMFLHLTKQEYNSLVPTKLFQDIPEWQNRIVRKHNQDPESRSI